MGKTGHISEDSRRVAKNTLFLYFRMFILMAIGVVTSRVILKSLGVESYGIYNAVAGVVVMFTLLSNSIAQAISRFITFELGRADSLSDGRSRLREIFSASVWVQAALSLLLIILVNTAGLWFLYNKMAIPDGRLSEALGVMELSVVSLIINLFAVPYNATIIAHERMDAFAWISLLEAVLKLGVALAIWLCPSDRLVVYAVLMAAVSLLVRSAYAAFCRRRFPESRVRPGKDRPSRGVFREMAGFAGWNFFGSSAYVINTQGMNLLTNVFFGVTANAARGVATTVEGMVKQFATNFLTAVNPQITKSFAAGKQDYSFVLATKASRYTYIILLLFVLPILFEADWLLELWLDVVPPQSAEFVKLALLGVMVDMVFNPLLTLELAYGKIRNYYIATGLVSYLALPAAWLLFRFTSLSASATYLVFIATYVVVDVLRLLFVVRQVHFPAARFLFDILVRCGAVTLVSMALTTAVSLYFPAASPRWLRFLAVISTSTAAIALSTWCFAMTKGEKAFFTGKLKTLLRNKSLGLLERLSPLLSDGIYLRLKYPLMTGKLLHLRTPVTYNEKLQWLKVNYRDPLMVTLVDKAAVKDFVAGKIGSEYLIPTLGLWDKASDIDFDALPERFVLKCTHDSGSAVICRDRESFDREKARKSLAAALNKDFYLESREWPYHQVPRRIIAEPYIAGLESSARDYKFFCFNGKPELMFVASDRYTEGEETKFDFFDMDFRPLGIVNGHPNSAVLPPKPENFEQMKKLAAVLSEGMPQVRIDFYEIDGQVLFGEYTFFHFGGLVPFVPDEWDRRMGELFVLPPKTAPRHDSVENGR